jgi:hypothetical protein
MSGSKQKTAIVHRDYEPQPEAMAQALEFLLRTPAKRKGGRALAALGDAKVRSVDDSRAGIIIPK